MSVVVVGLNHRTVPLGLLELMAVPPAGLAKALRDLQDRSNVVEAVLLSTCMRTEVYVEAERFHGAIADIRSFLAEHSGVAPDEFSDHLYSYYDEVAVSHLFEVAAGLDSAVVGESEVLGQVRAAWESAQAEGSAGPALSNLFRHAVEVGKRARTETAVGRGATSVSQAAVAMAAGVLGGLRGRSVLVIGAGEMGEGVATALAARGASPLLVANRSRQRALEVSGRVGGTAVAFDEAAARLAEVDVVLACTGSPHALLGAEEVEAAMAVRAGRPLLLVDAALPRDIDPAASAVSGVTLLDMDDLRAFAAAGLSGRRAEVDKVRAIIAEEVARHAALASARTVAPLVATLHQRFEELRQAELDRLAGRLAGLDERQREAVDALTKGLMAKLLHAPTVQLKETAGSPRGERLAEALRALFELG
ncbi:MAG TPA: glutamyl-tRNA reductase [Acidimicrobiales bacterium]|nr:glutamyl-tRNA reductase [Acidimicrobiales bacterium]